MRMHTRCRLTNGRALPCTVVTRGCLGGGSTGAALGARRNVRSVQEANEQLRDERNQTIRKQKPYVAKRANEQRQPRYELGGGNVAAFFRTITTYHREISWVQLYRSRTIQG